MQSLIHAGIRPIRGGQLASASARSLRLVPGQVALSTLSVSANQQAVPAGRLRRCTVSSPRHFSTSPSSRYAAPSEEGGPFRPELIRNISIIAHIDAGKTTLTERLLLYSQHQEQDHDHLQPSSSPSSPASRSQSPSSSGHISQPGSVDSGTTVTDFLDAERERGITIQSAAVGPLPWTPSVPLPSTPAVATSGSGVAKGKDAVTSAAAAIYLVDTPGHIDFTIEVERALRVVDGCVVVLDGVEGVEAQTEGVWRQASRYGIRSHIVFVNKLDRAGASVPRSILSLIQRNLHSRPLLLQLPIYSSHEASSSASSGSSSLEEEQLTGLIDLLTLDHLLFSGNAGEKLSRKPLSPTHPLFGEARRARKALIETLAEQDEELLERFLEVSDQLEEAVESSAALDLELVSAETHLRPALRRQTISGSIIPVLCGAAARNFGVQPLLDAIALYLPSPHEVDPPSVATSAEPSVATTADLLDTLSSTSKSKAARGKQRELPPHERDLAALAFKVVWDKRKGPITFIRVYSGTLSSRSTTLFNTTTQARERLSKVYLAFADQYVETASLKAGQIGVLMGLRDTRTGDTLIDARLASGLAGAGGGAAAGSKGASTSSSKGSSKLNALRLRPIHVPPPVFSMSIEPESKSDEASVNEALAMLVRTDPSLRLDDGSGGGFGSAGTGQTVLSGMGELHLEIARERLANEFGVRARMGSVRVSYRETMDDGAGEVVREEMWEKEVGGKRLKVGLTLAVRRLDEDGGEAGDESTGGNRIVIELDEDEHVTEASTGKGGSAEGSDVQGVAALDPEAIRHAFYTGLVAGLARGPISSNPLTGLHVTLSNPVLFGPELSPARALSMAAAAALRATIKSAAGGGHGASDGAAGPSATTPTTGGARMMEPVMRVRIECDASHMGKVVGDLTADQAGTVTDVEQQVDDSESDSNSHTNATGTGPNGNHAIGVYIPPDALTPSFSAGSRGSSSATTDGPGWARNRTIVHALVPLARLVSYSSRLRALTGGMGTFTMELHGFAQTSREREREILRALGKAV